MKTKLNDNEVREIAHMQTKIDSYEGFIRALWMMIAGKKEVKFPLFDGTDFTDEMSNIWRFVRDSINK